jgi:predicted RNase H-like HicB family nuclease
MQHLTVEIIPDTDQGGFTARVPDIPAYGEGASESEAMEDLRQALQAYVEAFGIDDGMSRLNPPSSLRQLDIELDSPIHA